MCTESGFSIAIEKHNTMTRAIIPGVLGFVLFAQGALAQSLKKAEIPLAVRNALTQKYPGASHIVWEKEKGNYEANWGGRSNEDNSAVFTPSGEFVEMVVAIPVSGLPTGVAAYVQKNYHGAKIKEPGKVSYANGKTGYEVEVNKKDMVFDEAGNFVRVDED